MKKNQHRKTLLNKYNTCAYPIISNTSSTRSAIKNLLLFLIIFANFNFTVGFAQKTTFKLLNQIQRKFKSSSHQRSAFPTSTHKHDYKLVSHIHHFPSPKFFMPNNRAKTKRARTSSSPSSSSDSENNNVFTLPPYDPNKHRPSGTMNAYASSPNDPPEIEHMSVHFSLDVSGQEYNLLTIMFCVIGVFLQVDPNFMFVKTINNNIVPNTELLPGELNTMEIIKEYATEILYDRFFDSHYVRFTLFIKTKETFFGGWIFNWLRHETSLIRLSPIITVKAEPICFFTWITLQTFKFDDLYHALDQIFGRSISTHLYEKTIRLKKKGQKPRSTRGIALDVASHEKDFATSKIFAELSRGVSVFSRFFKNVLPKPLNLSAKNQAHVRLFNAQSDWMEDNGHTAQELFFTSLPLTDNDKKLIEFMMKQTFNRQPLCLTQALIDNRVVFTCKTGNTMSLHDSLQDFELNNETNYTIATPTAAQTIRDHWASQSVISELSNVSDTYSDRTQASKKAKKSEKSNKPSKTKKSYSEVSTTSQTTAANSYMNEERVTQIVNKTIQPFKNDVNNRINATEKLVAQFKESNKSVQQAYKNLKKYQDAVKVNEETHRKKLVDHFKEVHESIQETDSRITHIDNRVDTQYKELRQDIKSIAKTQNQLIVSRKQFFEHLLDDYPELPDFEIEPTNVASPQTHKAASSSSAAPLHSNMECDSPPKTQKDSTLEDEHTQT